MRRMSNAPDPMPDLAAKTTRVIAPRQARSRATMERIVTAAEDLLLEKPFDQITIAEISARSRSAPTAFYARFSDKTALLLEIHERFLARTSETLLAALDNAASRDAHLPDLIGAIVTEVVQLYTRHHHLLRSVLLTDNATMYERAAELTRTVSTAIAARIPREPGPAAAEAERDVDFGVRTVLAVVQQHVLFGASSPARFTTDLDELAERLTVLVRAYLRDLLTD